MFLFASDTVFVKTFGDQYENQGENIMYTSDEHYVLVGSTYANDSRKSDAYIIKLDTNFNKVWSLAYGSEQLEVAKSVVETELGNYLIVGYTNSTISAGYDVYVLCLDSDGQFLWEHNYGGSDWDFGNDIIKRHDNTYLICGETFSYGNGASDMYLLNIDEFGAIISEQTFGGIGEDAAYQMIEGSDSSCYVVGKTFTLFDTTNIGVIKLDTDNNLVWERTIGGAGLDVGNGIFQAANGDLLISGSSNSYQLRTDLNIQIYRTDTALNEIWTFEAGNASPITNQSINFDDEALCIVERANGDIISGGYTVTYGFGGENVAFTNLTSSGSFIPGPSPYSGSPDERLKRGVVVNDSYIFIGTTEAEGQGNADIIIMYFDTVSDDMIYVAENISDTILLATSIDDINILSTESVLIFPNPASIDNLSYVVSEEVNLIGYKVYSASGQMLNEYNFSSSNEGRIQLQKTATLSNVIIIEFLFDGGNKVIKKVILQ